ncbi:hypothetical protein [Microbacterium sp. NPDC078849]|uniref:Gp37-like protein n=1 Tax=unclassified Microbacterium TaxID=2609290 RepID=UPI00344D0384
METGLKFVIYDKTNKFRRSFSEVEASAAFVANGISTAEFTLDDNDSALDGIVTKGARCAVWFRGVERFRGRIAETPGTGPAGVVTPRVEGDLRKLWDWQGWPLTTAPITAQTQAYRNYSGATETIFKTALQENLTRLGVPWTVAPSQGRGSVIPSSKAIAVRFHPLADKVLEPLAADGLVVVLSYHPQTGAVTVDVRPGKTVPGTLTIDSGVLDSFQFTTVAPTATRAVVGGRQEGEDRELKQYIDAARELDWGDIIEVFVDARNTEVGVDILPEAVEAVAEGAPAVGITVDAVESDVFRYGKTFVEGDFVNLNVGPLHTREQITSVEVVENSKGGVIVTPRIGQADAEPTTEAALGAAVAKLARGQRDQGRR